MLISALSRPDYHSYLLRLWRDGTPPTWRAALHCTATEQVYHFVTVEAMTAFLTVQLIVGADACADERTQLSSDDVLPTNDQV